MNSSITKLAPVKQEEHEVGGGGPRRKFSSVPHTLVVDLTSDSEDAGDVSVSAGNNNNKRKWGSTPPHMDEDGNGNGNGNGNGCLSGEKRNRGDDGNDKEEVVVLPAGFLDPLPPMPAEQNHKPPQQPPKIPHSHPVGKPSCKHFWKAGDYEGYSTATQIIPGGVDHVRVHPKFLHSNATSHKWALGAFAELLDNALDEACNGATFVNIDMVLNQKDGSPMLFIEDDGGGMDPDKMRSCMSLGYSAKSKIANMIGQYGNGFKTSTMRLGADVIVFSRCRGGEGRSCTQSIGLLSYTFLRSTGQEDIIVPMVDYEITGDGRRKLIRFTANDWSRNLETIKQWSPFFSEAELIQQFDGMREQGTQIILYNLWENDQGELELDFETDIHDIQVRGANRDQRMIEMAQSFSNSRHYLTYKHSLRSYASILYLRLPAGFRIILRGKDIEHHSLVNDLMNTQEVTYKPQGASDINHRENNMIIVTIGFVKDAKNHIDVQGFNIYHKNRLIKPFWRIWNPAGSDGRGVIGVLEANFIEPAHDKQGFERTTVMARLESRLISMQRKYWTNNCHIVGYAPRRKQKPEKDSISFTKETEATEITKPSSTGAVEPVPLITDPVPSVTQVEIMVYESEQSDHDIVQEKRQSDSCQILPDMVELVHEEAQHQHCARPSPQRRSKSLKSRKHIVGQQNSPQRCLDSAEPHARESQQMHEVHAVSSNIPEQLHVTEQSQDLLERSLQSIKHIVGKRKSPQRHLDSLELHDKVSQQPHEVHPIPSEILEQLQVTEQSQDLQKRSLQSRKHTAGQKKCPQRCLDSPELCARENWGTPEIHSIPLAHPEQLQVMEQSQDLQKRSLQSRKNIFEQQRSSQRQLDSLELHARENRRICEVHFLSSEIPEQLQFMDRSLDLQKRSLQSAEHIAGQKKSSQRCFNSPELHARGNKQLHEAHSVLLEHPEHHVASSLSTPVSRPPTEVDFNQMNRELDSVVTATKISQVCTRTAVDGIESFSTTANAIARAELGFGSNLQSHNVSREFDSTSIHENNTDSESFHVVNANRQKQLEEENNKLKERIKALEETMLQSLQMEIEKNINLQAHIEELEKNLEASQRSLSTERLQRDLEENELQNKLKNAQLRIQELEQKNNCYN